MSVVSRFDAAVVAASGSNDVAPGTATLLRMSVADVGDRSRQVVLFTTGTWVVTTRACV